jgi:hypothetical protein
MRRTVVGTNLFGMMVTSYLGAVFRAVLLTTRTVIVWVVDLLLYKYKARAYPTAWSVCLLGGAFASASQRFRMHSAPRGASHEGWLEAQR